MREPETAGRCISDHCVCCICSLRGSAFGSEITDEDPCCPACHAEVAAPDWPGYRCSTLAPASPVPTPESGAAS